MKTTLIAILSLLAISPTFAGNHDPKAIIPLLKNAKMTLVEGIDYAAKLSGPVTSAKFEVSDDGKLMLSVYTIPEGLGVEPENTTLSEVSGDVAVAPFKSEVEVFTDKEHIARASVHMTLLQLSKLTLKQTIQRALARQAGSPIDVRNPRIVDGRPVADVIIAMDDCDEDDEAATVRVDLLSGATRLLN